MAASCSARSQEDGPYVLSDPDLLNDLAIERPRGRQGRVDDLITTLSGGGSVAFDVSLNGFGRSRDPLRLIFEPPLLGATLCAAAAALLIGCSPPAASARPAWPGRAFDLGKRALADNSAALIARARREPRMARPYAELTRTWRPARSPRRAGWARRSWTPSWTAPVPPPAERDGPAGRRWPRRLAVRDGAGLVRLARRLHRWRMGFVHGHR